MRRMTIIKFIVYLVLIGCLLYAAILTIMIVLVLPMESINTSEPSVFEDSSSFEDSLTYREYNTVIKCEELAQTYYKSHIYLSNTYDCDDMACDMWNVLQAEGIDSDIVIGNVEQDIYRGDNQEKIVELVKRSNHAWILANIEDGFLAIECTTGQVVYHEDNSLYYHGLIFDNPKDFRRYLALINEYDYQYMEYESALNYHNDLIDWYNNLNGLSQSMNRNTLTVSENNLNREIEELNRIINEISSLIK